MGRIIEVDFGKKRIVSARPDAVQSEETLAAYSPDRTINEMVQRSMMARTNEGEMPNIFTGEDLIASDPDDVRIRIRNGLYLALAQEMKFASEIMLCFDYIAKMLAEYLSRVDMSNYYLDHAMEGEFNLKKAGDGAFRRLSIADLTRISPAERNGYLTTGQKAYTRYYDLEPKGNETFFYLATRFEEMIGFARQAIGVDKLIPADKTPSHRPFSLV